MVVGSVCRWKVGVKSVDDSFKNKKKLKLLSQALTTDVEVEVYGQAKAHRRQQPGTRQAG